jgi:hypothetical protein
MRRFQLRSFLILNHLTDRLFPPASPCACDTSSDPDEPCGACHSTNDTEFEPGYLDGKGPRRLRWLLQALAQSPPPPGVTVRILPILRCHLSDVLPAA